jgi:hypothetical protein
MKGFIFGISLLLFKNVKLYLYRPRKYRKSRSIQGDSGGKSVFWETIVPVIVNKISYEHVEL